MAKTWTGGHLGDLSSFRLENKRGCKLVTGGQGSGEGDEKDDSSICRRWTCSTVEHPDVQQETVHSKLELPREDA